MTSQGIFLILTTLFSRCYYSTQFSLSPWYNLNHHDHVSYHTILHESYKDNDNNDNIIIDTNLPKDESIWKKEGENIIINAALKASNGHLKEDDINIQWKSGRIIITIKNAILKAVGSSEDDNVEVEYDDDDDSGSGFYLADVEEDDDDDDDEDQHEDEDTQQSSDDQQVDVVTIARAINFAFGEEGEGSLGYNIAVHHEIEVTTPGASDELEGIMFESYKGFNVIVETIDPKNKDKKVKIVEGNLVERNDQFTVLNCKGRRRNLKNANVLSVKLPKAKKEKGVK